MEMKFLRPVVRLDIVELKRIYLKYIVLGLCALILSSGPICMAFIYAREDPGMNLYWLQIPFTALMAAEMWLTLKVLIPKLLDKGRYPAFGGSVALLAYLVNILAIWVSYYAIEALGLPIIVKNPMSVWVWVECLAACLVGVFLLCGMALWHVYDRSERHNAKEREIKRVLEEKTRRFKEGIRMREVEDMLDKAIATVESNPADANRKIRELSDFLRKHLYDKSGRFEPGEQIRRREEVVGKHATDLLIARKYRWMRHACLITVFLVMSTGLFFGEPDHPDVSTGSLIYTGIFFLVLTALTYLNIFLIFPFFQRRGKVGLYGWCLFILMTVIGVLMYAATWKPGGIENDYGVRIPDFILFISVVGNILTFFFIFAGTASIMLLKGNLEGKWRVSHEESEAARLEFETLQRQINPHFLFNVLNNAGILSYEDPGEAVATLKGMKSFLEYMVRESGKESTTFGDELTFIEDYLTMEKSSGKELDLVWNIEKGVESYRLPPLLLIPFVENAVKHSRAAGGRYKIRIEAWMIEERLRFVCVNRCGEGEEEKKGGLGIANTRRRLDFLYGGSYRLSLWKIGGEYRIELIIPEKR